MTPVALLLLALSCRDGGCGAAPQLRAQVEAARVYDAGREALQRGEAEAAALSFAEAERLDPGSPALPAWRARALEQAGRDEEALAVLDEALGRFPEDPDLRFNRAALRARAGQLDLAATDLHLLLSRGLVAPEQAAADADLRLLRARPELAALVPEVAVQVEVQADRDRVLVGEPWVVAAELVLPTGEGATTLRAMGEATGLLVRERVVEDVLAAGDWRSRRRLELTWRAVRPGKGEVGPWLVAQGGTSALTERLPVEVVALGARQQGDRPPGGEELVLPSARVGALQPPYAGALDDRLMVLSLATDAVEVEGAAGGAIAPEETWELREQGQTRWVARLYLPSEPATVRIRRGAGPPLLESRWP